MKFLVDNALSPQVSAGLIEAGYDAVHVRDLAMADAPDIALFKLASNENRIIVFDDERIRIRQLPTGGQ